MTAEERDRRAFEIFASACEAPPAHRAALLDQSCNGDQELRQRVQAMLNADSGGVGPVGNDADVDAFLIRQVRQVAPQADTPLRAEAPAVDGEYTILRVIGEGGMGTVYEAEQHHPRRRVAIKAIRPGRITPQMRKRFEYEAQVLARLEHQGIARLYEFNTQSEGGRIRAFLAMELVLGEHIDAYATSQRLSIRARLRLFMKVCDAIAYAHRMGVIHRDLKPANIVVNPDGEPKVLDFGVARAVEENTIVNSGLTEHGQLIGTLAYMAPEQVDVGTTIDTRADVYSLGVILYKLLTGTLPISVEGVNLLTLTRQILNETPVRLREHNKRLRGDLEIIVARALEKEPARRYPGVDQLRDEIARYLSGRPIEARADSRFYWLRKQLWRYRAAAGATLLVVGLITAFGVNAWMQANRNRRLAEVADQARVAAVTSEAQATDRAAQLRNSLYINNIGFAQSALENNDMERAHMLLDGCDPDLHGWEWSYLQRLCDLSEHTTKLNLDRPRYASFTEDHSLVALATLGREAVLLNHQDQHELFRVKLDAGTARAAVSRDGKWFAYGGVPGQIFLVKVAEQSRRELKVDIPLNPDPTLRGLRLLGFTDNSATLIVSGLDGVVRVWDVASATLRKSFPLMGKLPICMFISPDGKWVIIGDSGGGLRNYDLQTGQMLQSLEGHDAAVWCLAPSPDGKRLASGDNDARAIIWELATGQPVTQFDTNDGWITSLCFNPDGNTLAEGRADSTVRLIHLPDAAMDGVLRGHRRAVIQVDWQQDGTLNTISLDGTSKHWNLTSALQVPTIVTSQPESIALAFHPDGSRLYVGGSDGTVRSWNVEPRPGEQLREQPQLTKHDLPVLELATDAVHGRICAAGRGGIVRVSTLDGELVQTINPAAGAISGIAFALDGQAIVVGTARELGLWDVSSGAKLRTYSALNVVANEVTCDSKGEVFFVACADGHVRKWRVDSAQPMADALVDAGGLYDVRPSPDGKTLIVTGDTQSVTLLDAQTLRVIQKFPGQQGAVLGAAFHPNGKRLATCGSDRSIRIWDVATATELIALRGHRRTVQHVQFSPDGSVLASTSDDGTVKLWRGSAQ
ncbi:MAG TPA: protein kinase [Tepidisphaeraceae bacterium]|jgi:WD40 repeat protein/serine/threonine protein kinase